MYSVGKIHDDNEFFIISVITGTRVVRHSDLISFEGIGSSEHVAEEAHFISSETVLVEAGWKSHRLWVGLVGERLILVHCELARSRSQRISVIFCMKNLLKSSTRFTKHLYACRADFTFE